MKTFTLSTVGESDSSLVEIPHHGYIAAGTPIEVIESNDTVTVAAHLVRGTMFALTIQGDSMVEDGYNDGDIIMVEERQTANPGDTVVALIDREKATVKKYWPEGKNVRLKPANPDYPSILYLAGRVQIQGIVRGLVRGY